MSRHAIEPVSPVIAGSLLDRRWREQRISKPHAGWTLSATADVMADMASCSSIGSH